jgi:hypothetical protein
MEKRFSARPNEQLEKNLAKYKETVNAACCEDRRIYEANMADTRSTKRLFKYFKSVRGASPIPPTVNWQNQNASTPIDQAILFNNFFTSVFVRKPPSQTNYDDGPSLITDYDVSMRAISTITSNIDVTKSRGPDDLPPSVFKRLPALFHSLATIFNKIKQTNSFPTQWKSGKVTPIFKKKSKLSVTNYRPITLLDIVSKIFQKCIFDALYPHVSPLIHRAQFGFQKSKSTTLQLICFLDDIHRGIEQPANVVEAVYLDFSKAFDKINHDTLLKKLRKIGVGGRLFKIIQSYLTDRRQFVDINCARSPAGDVTSGVPQGSILGPLLFLVYVLGLPEGLYSFPYGFADDTKLLSIHDRSSTSSLQHDLSILESWCSVNDMEFNADKCARINFDKSATTPAVSIYDQWLPDVASQLDLGITISQNLKWSEHIRKVVRKASNVLGLLVRNSCPSLTAHHKLQLYKSMVVPVITYGNSVWTPSKTYMCTTRS